MLELNVASSQIENIVSASISEDWKLSVEVAPVPLLIVFVVGLLVWLAFKWWSGSRFPDFEIDSAEFGWGDQKLSFKPNVTDRQIAYSIWVELSTRKIGIPINLDDDVVSEIYDSWHSFFGVTRELIKSIPVSKVNRSSTNQIISLSIEVLNEGLRPHLTKWQARFRRWNDRQLKLSEDASPQEVQKDFPEFESLATNMIEVNDKLILYRLKMHELLRGIDATDG
ncbi:MAG: hypothetical protein Pars2KO_31620 [Parasphingorhabdus sp.]